MSVFKIRTANAGDHTQLCDILKAQLDEHSIPIDSATLASAISLFLEYPEGGAMIVAANDSVLAGVACVTHGVVIEHGGIGAWLQEFYVVPAHRRQGIGQKLLDGVFDYCRKKHCVAIDLEIEHDHRRVEELYKRNGFRSHTRTRWVKVLGA